MKRGTFNFMKTLKVSLLLLLSNCSLGYINGTLEGDLAPNKISAELVNKISGRAAVITLSDNQNSTNKFDLTAEVVSTNESAWTLNLDGDALGARYMRVSNQEGCALNVPESENLWREFSPSVEINIGDLMSGESGDGFVLYYLHLALSGNYKELATCTKIPIKIDTVPPLITIDEGNIVVSEVLSVIGTCEAGSEVELTSNFSSQINTTECDGGFWRKDFDLQGPISSSFTFEAKQVDAAGNEGLSSANYDLTGPTPPTVIGRVVITPLSMEVNLQGGLEVRGGGGGPPAVFALPQ